jgi:hypothetical protein
VTELWRFSFSGGDKSIFLLTGPDLALGLRWGKEFDLGLWLRGAKELATMGGNVAQFYQYPAATLKILLHLKSYLIWTFMARFAIALQTR